MLQWTESSLVQLMAFCLFGTKPTWCWFIVLRKKTFSEIWIIIPQFSFKKIHLKESYAKCRSFCSDPNGHRFASNIPTIFCRNETLLVFYSPLLEIQLYKPALIQIMVWRRMNSVIIWTRDPNLWRHWALLCHNKLLCIIMILLRILQWMLFCAITGRTIVFHIPNLWIWKVLAFLIAITRMCGYRIRAWKRGKKKTSMTSQCRTGCSEFTGTTQLYTVKGTVASYICKGFR